MAETESPNCVTAVAKSEGRDYVTPEDISQALRQHEPHIVRADVLEVLGKQTAFGWEDATLCAYVAWKGVSA